MRFLINATNLHTGGGVQAAASVITELSALKPPEQLDVLVSTILDRNLRSSGADVSTFGQYAVRDVTGLSALWRMSPSRIRSYDAVLTIFGPLYSAVKPRKSAVGFAQAWIIYPKNELTARMTRVARLKTRLKFSIQGKFFSRADLLIVELEHVKNGLVSKGLMGEERIRVIPNTLSSIYLDPSRWKAVPIGPRSAKLRLGFVGRNYSHKNTRIFPEICKELGERFGLDARFYVTFTDREWSGCTAEFRSCATNVGPLSVSECPSFYEQMDGIVFPSLLECFSATPLEAMAMRRPLFASDRSFVHDVCGKHANYFDPHDPRSAARCIGDYFTMRKDLAADLDQARERALSFPSARERAERYLNALRDLATSDRQDGRRNCRSALRAGHTGD
jgi:glycosyltransferase involved in cell wall biosynthesis